MEPALARVVAPINIVGRGMNGHAVEQNAEDMDPRAAAAIVNQDRMPAFNTAHYRENHGEVEAGPLSPASHPSTREPSNRIECFSWEQSDS
jgi:hypothetical protein